MTVILAPNLKHRLFPQIAFSTEQAVTSISPASVRRVSRVIPRAEVRRFKVSRVGDDMPFSIFSMPGELTPESSDKTFRVKLAPSLSFLKAEPTVFFIPIIFIKKYEYPLDFFIKKY